MDAESVLKKPKVVNLNKGQEYEAYIRNLLKEKGIKAPLDLAGNDAGFNHMGVDYYVEVKNSNAPDFGQKGLIWDKTDKWKWREVDDVSLMFDEIGVIGMIDKTFEPKRYTTDTDKLTLADKQSDMRAFEKSNIELKTAAYLYNFYARRKCYYIQIEKRGFYYLQKDIANLGVPQFAPDLTLRLRAKTHDSKAIHHYSFFAVIRADKRSIGKTDFDLEEKGGRKFPPIKSI
jgi:hypothetical protein